MDRQSAVPAFVLLDPKHQYWCRRTSPMSWLESLKSSSAARLVSSAAREIFSESTSETVGRLFIC